MSWNRTGWLVRWLRGWWLYKLLACDRNIAIAFRHWQGKAEGAAHAGRALYADARAHRIQQQLNNGKAHARAAERPRGTAIHLIEGLAHTLHLVIWDTESLIRDGH